MLRSPRGRVKCPSRRLRTARDEDAATPGPGHLRSSAVADGETPERRQCHRVSEHPNTSPPEPTGPRYVARVALSCVRGRAPGQVLHALQGLRSALDERLRDELGGRYDRHAAESAGTDKLTVTFTLRAATHADAIRSAGVAAGALADVLTEHSADVDLSGVALVVRAQAPPATR